MFDVAKFLDRAKAAAKVDTDYKLAVKVLGYAQQSTVTNWRSGRSVPDERAILKLCELTGDDPVDVAVRLQSMRAANDDAAGLWRRVAERLKGSALVLLVVIVAGLSMPDANAALPYSDCYVKWLSFVAIAALARLCWRWAALTRAATLSDLTGAPNRCNALTRC